MSRTRHHRHQNHQHCGEDLWSRRAGMSYHSYSTYNKRLTIQKERVEEKDIIRKELENEMIGRNRMANVGNQYQGSAKRVLCVCSAGLLRSPTTAWVLSNPPFNFNTRAVGAEAEYALIPIDEALIAWADEIVCMGERHAETLMTEFGVPVSKAVHVLDVPDDFAFRSPELVEIVTQKCRAIWEV